MAESFATVDDLAVFPGANVGTTDAERERAGKLLEYVSASLVRLCDTGEVPTQILQLVTCQVAARMMQASETGIGVSQESWAATPYSGSYTFSNPSGDIYLTSYEKRLLGIDEPLIAFINPEVPDVPADSDLED